MSIQNHPQLETTRKKLLVLEERCRTLDAASDSMAATPAREISVLLLKKLINQMNEEIARFESRDTRCRLTPIPPPIPPAGK